MGIRELSAVPTAPEMSSMKYHTSHHNHVADWMVEEDDDDNDDEEEEEEEVEVEVEVEVSEEQEREGGDKKSNKNMIESVKLIEKVILSNIVDYTEMATHVWIDGIRNPLTGRYLLGYTPFLYLTKRAINRNANSVSDEDSLAMGGRPLGSIEKMMKEKNVLFQPPIIRIIVEKKIIVEENPKILSNNIPMSIEVNTVSSISNNNLDASVPVLTPTSIKKVNESGNEDENENENDDDDDDDDFFGTARTIMSPRGVRIEQQSFIPVMTSSTSTSVSASSFNSKAMSETADTKKNVFGREEDSSEILEPPTVGEVEDLRKSKKQRIVSVQARLAERQRFLFEAQQKRQSVATAVIKNKEDQSKEYKMKKTSLLSSVTLDNVLEQVVPKAPSSSDFITDNNIKGGRKDSETNSEENETDERQSIAERRREEFSLRTLRTNFPGDDIRIITREKDEEYVIEDDDDDDGLWA